ncbi:MAG: hypothetical protein RLY57_15 [Candidatus Parcubacteria bacterium]
MNSLAFLIIIFLVLLSLCVWYWWSQKNMTSEKEPENFSVKLLHVTGPCPVAHGCEHDMAIDAKGNITRDGVMTRTLSPEELTEVKSIIKKSGYMKNGCTDLGVTDNGENWTVTYNGETKSSGVTACKELTDVMTIMYRMPSN